MERNKINRINTLILWGIFLFTNILFIYKYSTRIDLNPLFCSIIYGLAVTCFAWLYHKKIYQNITERSARNISFFLTLGIVISIGLAIFFIDPLTIRVDRWSATSYFIDALCQGIYPYSVHTHVSETNFPSPSPLWHYFNIPFWLIGDVGWTQAFFLLLFLAAAWYYFDSWRVILSIILLLCISPSYWWEVTTRSDSVSNILLVLSCILFIQRKRIEMSNRWWLLALFAGCIASTRLSSIIPMALFLFRPWLDINWKKKIGFLGIVLGVVIFFFLPYVFWDTTNWIFFERNPFITQTLQGNRWILGVMIIIAIAIAYRKQTFYYYISTTSAFLFTFMLVSLLCRIWIYQASLFSPYCDISYLTLSLPFAIIALVDNKYE